MQADRAVRIIVAEQDALTRAGLVAVLRSSQRQADVHSVADLDAAIPLLSSAGPADLLIVNAELLGTRPDQAVNGLRRGFPEARLAVLGRAMTRELILSLLAAGTHGCVPQDMEPSQMASVFQSIVLGQVYVPPLLSEVRRVAEPLAPYHAEPIQELTERQIQVLELMANGSSNKQIARQLGIAEGTVKIHLHAAFKILGVHNRVSALAALAALDQAKTTRQPLLPGFDKVRRRASDLLLLLSMMAAGYTPALVEIPVLG